MNIKETVSELVKKYNTRNPFELSDQMGIVLRRDRLGTISGYYVMYCGLKCICINSDISNQKFLNTVMAHELGHAVLHEDTYFMFFENSIFEESKYETQANCFAAELLIPDSIIFDNPGMSRDQLAVLTGYSERLLNYKKIR